jgi:hypothetical protein
MVDHFDLSSFFDLGWRLGCMTLKVTAFNFGLGFLGFLEINNLDLFEVVHHVWLIYIYKRKNRLQKLAHIRTDKKNRRKITFKVG